MMQRGCSLIHPQFWMFPGRCFQCLVREPVSFKVRIKTIFGCGFRDDVRPLARIRERATASWPAGYPVYIRGGREVFRELPPAAAVAKEFRARARPQPSQGSPTGPISAERPRVYHAGRSDKAGRLATVDFGELSRAEVEHVLETHQHQPPQAGTLLAPQGPRERKRGSQRRRDGSPFSDSSRSSPGVTITATDKNSARTDNDC